MLDTLPPDLLHVILSHLPLSALIELSLASRALRLVIVRHALPVYLAKTLRFPGAADTREEDIVRACRRAEDVKERWDSWDITAARVGGKEALPAEKPDHGRRPHWQPAPKTSAPVMKGLFSSKGQLDKIIVGRGRTLEFLDGSGAAASGDKIAVPPPTQTGERWNAELEEITTVGLPFSTHGAAADHVLLGHLSGTLRLFDLRSMSETASLLPPASVRSKPLSVHASDTSGGLVATIYSSRPAAATRRLKERMAGEQSGEATALSAHVLALHSLLPDTGGGIAEAEPISSLELHQKPWTIHVEPSRSPRYAIVGSSALRTPSSGTQYPVQMYELDPSSGFSSEVARGWRARADEELEGGNGAMSKSSVYAVEAPGPVSALHPSTLITGNYGSTVALYDLRSSSSLPVADFHDPFSDDPVYSVSSGGAEGFKLAAGVARYGVVRMWDVRWPSKGVTVFEPKLPSPPAAQRQAAHPWGRPGRQQASSPVYGVLVGFAAVWAVTDSGMFRIALDGSGDDDELDAGHPMYLHDGDGRLAHP